MSLTIDSWVEAAVRIETVCDCGAAPGKLEDAPAAIPATMVPCPYWSPVALGSRDDRFTCVTRREPKSASRELSTPESTIAIVGLGGPGAASLPQRLATPPDAGQGVGFC